MSDIKPCPRCGAAVTVYTYGASSQWVSCANKPCRWHPGPARETAAEAIEAWSDRHEPKEKTDA